MPVDGCVRRVGVPAAVAWLGVLSVLSGCLPTPHSSADTAQAADATDTAKPSDVAPAVDTVHSDDVQLQDGAAGAGVDADTAPADGAAAPDIAGPVDAKAAKDTNDTQGASQADAPDGTGVANPGADAAADVAPDVATLACTCGDGFCNNAAACKENIGNCSQDCSVYCGDTICSPGEGPKNCPADCCGGCGDGKCTGYECGESSTTCPKDCGNACGNKTCDKGESPATCAEDCAWKVCGNGICEGGEGVEQCPQDCAASCGDCSCDGGEDFASCPVDCGWCGDGVCSNCAQANESVESCANDCSLKECNPKYKGKQCNDGEACTYDACSDEGKCQHFPNETVNLVLAATCTDANDCTGQDHCEGGTCAPGKLVECNDDVPCTFDSCVAQGGCEHSATQMNGKACSDQDKCSKDDACQAGVCHGSPLSCDDGKPCTADSCDKSLGCLHVSLDGEFCDDNNSCTLSDTCSAGQCLGSGKADCDDNEACTIDSCDWLQGCVNDAQSTEGGKCSDGSLCTKGDVCTQGKCLGQAINCSDGSPCTDDDCDPSISCTHLPAAATACDDGNACTVSDICAAGWCKPGKAKSCDDKNFCTVDSCDASDGCVADALLKQGNVCDDGNACTTGDQCLGGACVGGPVNCDDKNGCTADACKTSQGCLHESLDATPCNDGSICTVDDACLASACVPGAKLNCDDVEPCTVDACDPKGGCAHDASANEGSKCSDGSLCTAKDSCIQGKCTGVAVACDDGNVCTDDDCDVAVSCTHLPGAAVACDDGDACTIAETCKGGACVPGKARSCDDSNACTADICDPVSACLHIVLSGDACDDADVCSIDDICVQGACKGTPKDCADNDPCTSDPCLPGSGCDHVPASGMTCDDGSFCTKPDICQAGTCTAGVSIDCSDGNDCTTDTCDPLAGCKHANLDGVSCQDGNSCTATDTCVGGVCIGGGHLLRDVQLYIGGTEGIGRAIVPTQDDGFVLAADVTITVFNMQAIWLSRYDNVGDVLWTESVGGMGVKDQIGGVAVLDNDAEVVAYTEIKVDPVTGLPIPGADTVGAVSMRAADTGQFVSATGAKTSGYADCVAAPGGGVVVVGHLGSKGLIERYNASGMIVSPIWDRTHASGSSDALSFDSVATDSQGGLYAAGHLSGGGLVVVRFTAQGAEVASMTAPGSDTRAASIALGPGGVALVLGQTGPHAAPKQARVVRFTAAGQATPIFTAAAGTMYDGMVAMPPTSVQDSDGRWMLAGWRRISAKQDAVSIAGIDAQGRVLWANDKIETGLSRRMHHIAPLDARRVVWAGDIGTSSSVMCFGIANGWGAFHCDTATACAVKSYVDCADGDYCTFDQCDQGTCSHTPVTAGLCDDDGNPCTIDQCAASGACQHVLAPGLACTGDGTACTNDVCDDGGNCLHLPINSGGVCETDGNVCTSDACTAAGVCAHQPTSAGLPCPSDNNACTTDTCTAAGQCGHDVQVGLPCVPPGPCIVGSTCGAGGTCSGGTPKDCNDNNPCTNDNCDTSGSCINTVAKPAFPKYCAISNSCWTPSTDCSTVQLCGGSWRGCSADGSTPHCSMLGEFNCCTASDTYCDFGSYGSGCFNCPSGFNVDCATASCI